MSRYKGTNVPKQPTVPPMPKKRRYIDESILVEKVYNGEGLPTISRSVLVNCVLPTIPTADVRENVRGEWREENPREKSMMWRCSVCGRIAYYPTIGERKNYKKHCGYNYCPNCGADMRGGDAK